MTIEEVRQRVTDFLRDHDHTRMARLEFLRARYDTGLAWVHFPVGHGGLGIEQAHQSEVDRLFAEAGAPDNDPRANEIGLGMAAPTILAFGTDVQKERFLRPLWTGEEPWCQLFSEPGAGSDLANIQTRAVRDGDGWVINGQKVWTSKAHGASFAILVARTDPDKSKHAGLSYFLCDMSDPGVDVRPLRQITGEAEFNEVFLTDVRIGDDLHLGDEGDGWRIAKTTLNYERVSIGKGAARETGMIRTVCDTWRSRPELRRPELHDSLMRLWVDAEVARITGVHFAQKLATQQPGPEASIMKLFFARISQELSGLELELLAGEGLRFSDWTMVRPTHVDFTGRDAGYRYLRAKGNSIEGGTSEIIRNVIAERVLGLPAEPRADTERPWKELAR
jgi:alkylation response protein AidB-like acyl-CoA dehydrogenase